MKKIISISIIIMLTFSSCFESPDITTGEIVGCVSDKSTGELISVANVLLQPIGISIVTGRDGTFSYKDIEPGKYTIEVNKEGYFSNSSEVEVSVGKISPLNILIERIPDKITSDRDLLDFGDNTSLNTLTFGIVNRSYENLEWNIVENSEWITKVTPEEGLLKYGKTESIVVVIDRSNLEEGVNFANLVVTSKGVGYTEVQIRAVGEKKPTMPTLEIYDATDIRGYSATLKASITDAGYPTYTERGFVYSELLDPTIENNIGKVLSPKNTALEYSAKIENLTINTTYYVRSYAINESGVAYSNNISFTTIPILPQVETYEVVDTNLSEGTATFRGTIISEGEPTYTERGFVYSELPDPTIENNIGKVLSPKNTALEYSAKIENLTINTTYYVRSYAINESGVAYSNNISFTTIPILPQVETYEVVDTNLSEGTATFRGTIISEGEPTYTECGFVYSTQPYPTINDNKIAKDISGVGAFSVYVTGLPKINYYVRAYAKNEAGVAYGKNIEANPIPYVTIPGANLMVQKNDLACTRQSDAEALCESSVVGGYDDWRLPTTAELSLLYAQKDYIGGFKNGDYWSSYYKYSNPNYYYYYLDFTNGYLNRTTSSDNRYYVRAVRTIK